MGAHLVMLGTASPDPLVTSVARYVDVADAGRLAVDMPDDGRPVIVVAERRHARALGREAALLAQRTGVPGVARRPLPHGPLALWHLVALVAGRPALGAALALELLDRLAARTVSAAWLPAVARLEDPVPSFGQHMLSWVPWGAGFLVVHAPRPQVHAARRLPPALGPGSAAYERSALLMAGAAPDTVVGAVSALTGTREVRPVPAVASTRERYGTERGAEFAALPADLAALLAGLDALPRCPSCGLELPRDICPFCHTSRHPITVGTAP